MTAAFAWLRREAQFIVLLAVCACAAGLYVKMKREQLALERMTSVAGTLCAAAGAELMPKGGKTGEACRVRIAGLASFETETARVSAETLAKAARERADRSAEDARLASAAAQMALDAANRMENADAVANRTDVAGPEWFAALNGVAGLHPPAR